MHVIALVRLPVERKSQVLGSKIQTLEWIVWLVFKFTDWKSVPGLYSNIKCPNSDCQWQKATNPSLSV